MFCYKFIAACFAYNKGKMTHDKVLGTWVNLMLSKLEITMQTNNVAKTNVKLHKMKSSGGGGSRGSDGGRGGVKLKRAVAVATMQRMNGCLQGP